MGNLLESGHLKTKKKIREILLQSTKKKVLYNNTRFSKKGYIYFNGCLLQLLIFVTVLLAGPLSALLWNNK
jgi:hypothetical protein